MGAKVVVLVDLRKPADWSLVQRVDVIPVEEVRQSQFMLYHLPGVVLSDGLVVDKMTSKWFIPDPCLG